MFLLQNVTILASWLPRINSLGQGAQNIKSELATQAELRADLHLPAPLSGITLAPGRCVRLHFAWKALSFEIPWAWLLSMFAALKTEVIYSYCRKLLDWSQIESEFCVFVNNLESLTHETLGLEKTQHLTHCVTMSLSSRSEIIQ